MDISSPWNLRGATALALSAILATTSAQAASGTWTQITSGTASGTWSDAQTGNWAGGVVAGGTDFTADFSTLDVSGTSTVTLGEPRTIGNIIFGDTGTTTLSTWVLAGTGTNTLTLSGAAPTITVNSLGAPTAFSNGIATISASISGTNGLIKNGNGTVASSATLARAVLVLSGSNNYSGGTTISSGALRASNNFALGTGDVTVASGAQLQLQGGVNIANTININGANALFSPTSTGGTPNLSGLVNLQSNSGINLASNSGNATMQLSGTIQLNGFVLSANTLNVDPSITLSAVISGSSGGITHNNAGTLVMSGNSNATYSGTTTQNAGVLALGSDGALGTGVLLFNPAGAATATVRSTGTTARTSAASVATGTNANARYLFGSSSAALNGNLTFTGTTTTTLSGSQKLFEVFNRTQINNGFAGTAGITMQNGTGTLVLNGSSSYSGTTSVNAGTLLVNGSLGASSGVTVSGTGVASATLGGAGTINGATTIGANAFLTPGEDGIAGNLTLGSSLSISGITTGIGALKFDLGTSSDMVTLSTGVLTIGSGLLEWDDFSFTALSGFAPGTYTLISTTQAISGTLGSTLSGTISGMNATISLGDGTDIILTVVPEPSVCLLAGAGLMSVLFLRRRSKI